MNTTQKHPQIKKRESFVTQRYMYPEKDVPELQSLISELVFKRKRHFDRPSQDHIKYHGINYHPSTGLITLDGKGQHAERGPAALLRLIESEYPKPIIRRGPRHR